MKKNKLIILLLLWLLLLAGCTKANIIYEIDANHNVILNYQGQIDLSSADRDLKNGVTNLIKDTVTHYENIGFETSLDITETMIEFDMILSKPTNSFQEAYETLKTVMIDPTISFLLQVDLVYHIEEYEHSLDLAFDTDLSFILNAAGFNNMPLKLREELSSQLNESELTIDVILPYSTIVDQNDEVVIRYQDQKTHIYLPIALSEKSSFAIVSRMSVDNDQVLPMDMNSSISKTNKQIQTFNMITYSAITIGGISIISLIGYLIKSKK